MAVLVLGVVFHLGQWILTPDLKIRSSQYVIL